MCCSSKEVGTGQTGRGGIMHTQETTLAVIPNSEDEDVNHHEKDGNTQ